MDLADPLNSEPAREPVELSTDCGLPALSCEVGKRELSFVGVRLRSEEHQGILFRAL